MTYLFSRYESGVQFIAGDMIGSQMGTSGLNAIADRLNSISTDNNFICGSLISGTSTQIFAGSINQTSGCIIIESRTSNPANPAVGRIWIRSDL